MVVEDLFVVEGEVTKGEAAGARTAQQSHSAHPEDHQSTTNPNYLGRGYTQSTHSRDEKNQNHARLFRVSSGTGVVQFMRSTMKARTCGKSQVQYRPVQFTVENEVDACACSGMRRRLRRRLRMPRICSASVWSLSRVSSLAGSGGLLSCQRNGCGERTKHPPRRHAAKRIHWLITLHRGEQIRLVERWRTIRQLEARNWTSY